MSPLVYQIMHVTAAILLVGFTFQAFAAPNPERRGATLRNTGILSILVLVGGFGLSAKMGYGFPVWMIIKLVCWLGLSAITGIAFRKPEKACTLAVISIVLVIVAVLAVYIKPFSGL
jgi:hypothetical protein